MLHVSKQELDKPIVRQIFAQHSHHYHNLMSVINERSSTNQGAESISFINNSQ